jgi:hypothetical protein
MMAKFARFQPANNLVDLSVGRKVLHRPGGGKFRHLVGAAQGSRRPFGRIGPPECQNDHI